jgi:hypothetical protein
VCTCRCVAWFPCTFHLYIAVHTGLVVFRVLVAVAEQCAWSLIQSTALLSQHSRERAQGCHCCCCCCCCLQVIKLLHTAFQAAGLGLYLRPYGCLPTGYECGIIEVSCCTNCKVTLVTLYVYQTIDVAIVEAGSIWSISCGPSYCCKTLLRAFSD